MIKVMIVDDEYLIRIGIMSTISWEENGFVVVGDASNGEEALKLFHELQPDIVITDIKMPKMDGLELTRQLKAIRPKIKIVILSSHNDFAFAKEALTLGASDYILKATMEPDEILKTLNGIKAQIERERDQTQQLNSLQHQLESQKLRLRNKVFGDFLKGMLKSEDENVMYLEQEGIHLPFGDFVVVCAKVDDLEAHYRKVDLLTKRLLRESLIHMFYSKMNEYYKGAVEEVSEGVFVVLLSVNTTQYACEDAGLLFAKAIQEAVKAYTRVTISISIGRWIRAFKDIHIGVEETLQFLKYKIIFGRNSLMPYKQMSQYDQELKSPISCEENKVRLHLMNGEWEDVLFIVSNVFQNICVENCSFIRLNYICTQYISLLNRISEETGFSREQDKIYFAIEEPMGLESVTEIEKWFLHQFKLLTQSIGMRRDNCGSGLIREAMRFIRNEYMNDISLGDVAEHVNISRIYFSQLFKQESGEKYIDFLNKVRIDKAKEYLAFHDLKSYEIAEKVGFQDSGYFAKMFKKVVGKTPSEFQKER